MAIARLYQTEAVEKAITRLGPHRAATLVLPTGAGKTVVAAFFVLSVLKTDPLANFIFLQHTEELLDQNMSTLARITGLSCSIVMGDSNDWSGRIVFASVPTLSRVARIVDLGVFSNMIVDECHHSAADSWNRIIEKARKKNPKLRILGLSATPERGDGKRLPKALGPIVHRVYIQELIDLGHLVPPRAYSVRMGDAVERIGRLKGADAGSGDQTKVAKILDTPLYNQAIVAQWKARAGGRQTVAFCSTVDHAKNVAAAFMEQGIEARAIDYDDKKSRREAIRDFKDGKVKVLTNCLLLTEGFDHQPTGCVIILRSMLHHSTFLQALGRALRVVDAEKHPGVLKMDAVCLDFAGAADRHSELDTKTVLPLDEVDLHDLDAANDDEPLFEGAGVAEPEDADEDFVPVLDEIDLAASQFRWTDIHSDGKTLLVSGLSGFAALCPAGDHWVAFGKEKNGRLHVLHMGSRTAAYGAAGDYIRTIETNDRAVGNRKWLNDPLTDGQVRALSRFGYGRDDIMIMNKYEASCHIVYMSERGEVRKQVSDYLDITRMLQAA